MKKEKGIHFYLNIKNFNNVVKTEEKNTGTVNHSIHALDTLFSSVEAFGKTKFKDIFFVEKITGGRLHLYFLHYDSKSINAMLTIARYSYDVTMRINKDIPKYKTLTDFKLQMGADVGEFFIYDFNYNDGKGCLFSETTTIGYPANFAAKLQALAETSFLCISSKLYELCDDGIKNDLKKISCSSLRKYGQTEYFCIHVSSITSFIHIDIEEEMKVVQDRARRVNLTDMSFSEARSLVSFNDLSTKNGKKISGVPLFADIRGFTSKFYSDGSNLNDMAEKTKTVLETMYKEVKKQGGVHIQFQGDREMALFHDINSDICVEKAVITALRLIDDVRGININIYLGAGCDYGEMFAAKIGARGEKDNILIGETVIDADRYEDEYADKNQIAISTGLFNKLKDLNSSLVRCFNKTRDNVYVATVGYADYLRSTENIKNKEDTLKNSYNGAWHE